MFLAFLFVAFLPFFAFAHSGKTDANGCHNNSETGDYHCHTKSNKQAKVEARKDGRSAANNFGQCEIKSTCKEMNSCEEANYFFNVCNLKRLDGDNDGIPCESLCK
ncbi:excalibur calcium-binding domain-containing protein [bacterium]|nr:excalibur calcium-binding domain-containing protein [bacterium]